MFSFVQPILRALTGVFVCSVLSWPALAATEDTARTALHLLDYVAVDYSHAVDQGLIANADEYKEMQEFAGQIERQLHSLPAPAHGDASRLLQDAAALRQSVESKASFDTVSQQAHDLRWAMVRAYDIRITPQHVPDLARGAALYQSQCAACHGAQGQGDGPAGAQLDPRPANFHDVARMSQRSVYSLYNAISLGVSGTAMAPYAQLSEDERWSLALFVRQFGTDAQAREHGQALWKQGVAHDVHARLDRALTLSNTEIRQQFGADAADVQQYLLSEPQAVSAAKPAPLRFAITTLRESLERYRAGDLTGASNLQVQAYLEGYELVEASLSNVDDELMHRIEHDLISLRQNVQSGAPVADLERQTEAVVNQLEQASALLDGASLSRGSVFASALIILLREGIETILVVAAILAFTRRSGRRDASLWVHGGWVAALALGGVTWVVSSYLVEISGAHREMTEGVTALISAAMLLYIGYWMHTKSNSRAWQEFIGTQINGSLATGALRSLGLVSFLAVYREAFETVLFLQALATQAGPGGQTALLGGLACATVLLVIAAALILRASGRLPLAQFFTISGLLMVLLAVVFTGQGVAALQEAGAIGITSVTFIQVPLLGIFPTAQTLAAQVLMIALCIFALRRATRARQG